MQWDLSKIRKNTWDTTFRRGWRAWLSLVTVCFLFSFIGARNAEQAAFVDGIDRLTGTTDVLQPHNMEVLEDYVSGIPWVRDLYTDHPTLFEDIANGVTRSASWVVRLLALNPRYFAANPGEVFASVLIVALLSLVMRFCVLNVIAVGQHRYVMETRYSRRVDWRRALAPFHLPTLPNVLRVMVCYHLTLLLWGLTVVGGVYKTYQYMMVPYLLAENPTIGWREARDLSRRMTDGYKWKMFLAQLSYVYISLLRAVPVLGLLVAVPLEEELRAELYFALRSAMPRARHARAGTAFVERTFDGAPYVRLTPAQQEELGDGTPVYVLQNLGIEERRSDRGPLPYSLVELVYIFMAFCFAGWVWEVGLHFFQTHEFANRGTLYGPWIPIYGVGGAGMVVLLDRYRDEPAKLFLMGVGLSAILEYATSFLLDFMFNASYWSYADMMFNVNGRICLAGLVAFGIGGLAAVYVAAPAIGSAVSKLPVRTRNLGALALATVFLGDVVYCLVNGFHSGEGVGEDL